MSKVLFTLLLAFISLNNFAQSKLGFGVSAGANIPHFQSFANEADNTPKPGHSLFLDGTVGSKWRLSPALGLRHYKNSVNVFSADTFSTDMSLDMFSFQLMGERALFSTPKFSFFFRAGAGMDYNFLIKSDPDRLLLSDYNRAVYHAISALKFQLSKFYLIASFEPGLSRFNKRFSSSSRIFDFKLGYRFL